MEKHEHTLSNNMKVILVPEHGLPIVEARGWMRAGAVLDRRRLVGGAILRMLTHGTDMHTREQFEDLLDKYGLIYQARASKFSPFFIEWSGEAMKRCVGELFWMVYESLRFSSFPESEFGIVKKRWESGIRKKASDPATLATEEIPRMIFGSLHPSHRLSSDEIIAQLRELTVENLRSFLSAHYSIDRAGIVIVGDFFPNEMYKLVRSSFEKWNQAREGYNHAYTAFDINDYAEYQGYEERVKFVPERSNAVLAIGQGIAMPNSNHTDYPALLIAVKALGGAPHARLFQNVRERCGLSYSVGAKLEDMNDAPGYFLVLADTNPENMPKTQEETWRVIKEFCERGITQEELDQEKIIYRGNRAFLSSSRATLAQEIVASCILGRSMDEFENIIMGLTVEEVNSAIRNYLDPAKMKVVRAGTVK